MVGLSWSATYDGDPLRSVRGQAARNSSLLNNKTPALSRKAGVSLLRRSACGHRLNKLAACQFARLGSRRAQFVFAKEIGQRLQPVRELLDRRAVLDVSPGQFAHHSLHANVGITGRAAQVQLPALVENTGVFQPVEKCLVIAHIVQATVALSPTVRSATADELTCG